MNSQGCHLVSLMQLQASVSSWKCALENQQYVTLLFYLDDICVFSKTVDQMLDRVALVFEKIKNI